MKKNIISILMIVVMILTGCAEKITLDNIDKVETEYLYSTIILNKYIKESEENKIITEAKDFTKKFISVQQNRSYDEKTSLENEKIMYSEEYKEKHKEKLDERIEYVKNFYNKNEIKTEVQSVDYKKIINLNGDAFVNAVSKVRLTHCENTEVAKILGYNNGVNSNMLCEYNIKLKYDDGEYFVYDYEIVEREGYLKAFESGNYEFELMPSFQEQEEINAFVYKLTYAQNNRDYKTFSGDEDYPYLSESYKAELNKSRDDVKYTKFVYGEYKINTQFVSCDVTDIEKRGDEYIVKASVRTKLLECISEEVAKNIGYSSGIGSETAVDYTFTIKKEKGEFKLFNSIN